jgi:hypothetical protein
MKELIRSRSFLVINLVFLIGAPFLILAEYEQNEIRAQNEPSFIALISSSPNIGENNTDVLGNDNKSGDKMEIQICDASHPC